MIDCGKWGFPLRMRACLGAALLRVLARAIGHCIPRRRVARMSGGSNEEASLLEHAS